MSKVKSILEVNPFHVPKSMFSYCFADLKAYSDDAFQKEDSSISLTDEDVVNAIYKKFPL